jgi:serine/threonine-protein kinase
MLNLDQTTLPSALLNNRYQILSVFGDGGFGKIFLAEDTQMPSARRCVVKQLKPTSDNAQVHQMVQERFQREAAILEKLGENHDQIPRLYANFVEADHFYLVEEWIDGETLTQKVQREGVLSENSVREILCGLLPAIAYVHQQQIVHRDIKPDNIIIRGCDLKPVLIDFGAVKESMSVVAQSSNHSSHSIVVGTPGYMPSEQLAGRPVYASDLYSLGLTAIYLLTGKHPQDLDSDPRTGEIRWQHYAPNTGPGFVAVLNRAIHMHPQSRFTTAEEMLTAVLTLISSGTLPSGPLQPATIISSAQPNSGSPVTQVTLFPDLPINSQVLTSQVNEKGELKKAIIMGGMIGMSILAGALVVKGQIPGIIAEEKTASSPSTVPEASTTASSPTTTNSVPASSPMVVQQPVSQPPVENTQPTPVSIPTLTPVANANATITGEPGVKNIRSGPSTNHTVLYRGVPGDRIRTLGVVHNSDGHPWYQVLLPNSTQGWIAGQLVALDQAVARVPIQSQALGTNATVVGQPGSKNVRSGAGTKYSVLATLHTGERVRIVGSGYDSGGYVWYKVFLPTGTEGWIAGQLIQRD